AKPEKQGVDLGPPVVVEHTAVADGEGARSEIADERLLGDGHARARSGDHCTAGNAEIGGGERAAVGDGERSALDDSRAADGERAAADRERRGRAAQAEREAADGADIAQRSRVVELERAGTGKLAGDRGGA